MKKTKEIVCTALMLASIAAMPALAQTGAEETTAAMQSQGSIAPRAQLAYGWGLYPNGISATAHSRSFLAASDNEIDIDSIGVKIVSTRTNGTTNSKSATKKNSSYCEVTLKEASGTSVDHYTSTHTFKSYMGTTVESVTKGPND